MIYKEIVDDQLYVYLNGSLLYKRWLSKSYGMIFCPIFKNFTIQDTESFKKETENEK